MAIDCRGAVEELPSLGVVGGESSVSGLSSGAFMAVQLHLAHSSCFVGAGVIAGGPFRCAESFRGAQFLAEDALEQTSLYIGMKPLVRQVAPDVLHLARLTRDAHARGRIDDPGNVRSHRVYIFSGTRDAVVSPDVVATTEAFYRVLGVPREDVSFVHDVPAGHAILTDRPEHSELAASRPPYINDGGFFQAHSILDHIYPRHRFPTMGRAAAVRASGRLIRFEQRAFVEGPGDGAGSFERSCMSRFGYAYVPQRVEAGEEMGRVHVVLHGCKQGYNYTNFVDGKPDLVHQPPYGDRYITTTGYNEYADANSLVMLYPQVEGRDGREIQNPKGCWDWWGYTCSPEQDASGDCDYYSRDAIQIRAIRRMLHRLGG